jgi:hypothetical protein
MKKKPGSPQEVLPSRCTARIDRIRISAHNETNGAPPQFPAPFRIVRDCLVRQQTSTRTYRRCREIVNEKTGTRLFWQYAAARSWLAPWRITFVGDDQRDIPLDDVLTTIAQCKDHNLLLVELAFDFTKSSGVNQDFILRHAIFGKSRPRPDRGGNGQLRYGSRASATMVRAYQKPEINRYRVEPELHSQFLRSHGLREIRQLKGLGRVLLPSRFRLVELDWDALDKHLFRRLGAGGKQVLASAHVKSKSIHAACQYLRHQGVFNVHRFLNPLPEDAFLQEALTAWTTAFEGAPNEN